MLSFLRNYQRYIFGVVAVATLSSFVFYGTSGAIGGVKAALPKEKGAPLVLGEAPFFESDLQAMLFLLEGANRRESALFGDFFEKEVLDSGLLSLIAKNFSKEVEGDLLSSSERIAHHPLYRHPQMPSLSLARLWEHVAPELASAYTEVTRGDGVSFEAMSKLYLAAKQCPPEFGARLVEMQLARSSLPGARFSLEAFSIPGSDSPSAFFGKNLMRVLCEYIHEVATHAKREGYKSSLSQGKALCLAKASRFGAPAESKETAIYPQGWRLYFNELALKSGFSEEELFCAATKIDLFSRYVRDRAAPLLLHPKATEALSRDLFDRLSTHFYHFGKELSPPSLWEMGRIELYLEKVFEKEPSQTLPTKIRSEEDLAREVPDWLCYKVQVEYQKSGFAEARASIPFSELIDFALSEEGWETLRKEAPGLSLPAALKSSKERESFIDAMGSFAREQFNRLALDALLAKKEELAPALLKASPVEHAELLVFGDGRIEAPGFAIQSEDLAKLFASSEDFEWRSEKGDLYHFSVISRGEKSIAAFQEISVASIDRHLEERLKGIFTASKEKGSWYEHKESLLRKAFPLLAGVSFGKGAIISPRVLAALQEKKEAALRGELSMAEASSQVGPLSLFNLECTLVTFDGREPSLGIPVDLFAMSEGSFSDPLLDPARALGFYEIVGREATSRGSEAILQFHKKLASLLALEYHEQQIPKAASEGRLPLLSTAKV